MDNQTYFNQTSDWANFWIQANSDNHNIHYIETEYMSCYVFEYPFVMGKKFWYIPRGFNLKKPDVIKLLTNPSKNASGQNALTDEIFVNINLILEQVTAKAKLNPEIAFIKFEINEFLLKCIPVDDLNLKSLTKKLKDKTDLNLKLSNKKLQYLSTRLINLGEVQKLIGENRVISDVIEDFWTNNQKWFTANLDKRTRYGTRKALEYGWKISWAKSKENFEAFYSLHQDTSIRQKFSIHGREYLNTLFRLPFTKIVILRDKDENPQAAWLGIINQNTIIHLYGGNSQQSRENYGQYMLNLAAVYIGSENDCHTLDLGGTEEGKGFDMFKKGYKGQEWNFYGPFDIVLDKWSYNLYHIARAVKGLTK